MTTTTTTTTTDAMREALRQIAAMDANERHSGNRNDLIACAAVSLARTALAKEASETIIAGRSLAEWKTFARRDDCLERMVPSELRMLVGALIAAGWTRKQEEE